MTHSNSNRRSWIRDDWRILLFGFLLMFFSSPGQTYFIALFGGQIRAEVGLSHGQFGALYSAATLCSAIVLLWSGKILDRAALGLFVCCVVLGLSIASLSISLASTAWSLFFALFLLRHFGQALMGTTSSTTMMRYVPAHKSKAGALAHMGYSAAEATLPILIVMGLAVMTWRELWQYLAAFIILALPIALTQLLSRHARSKSRSLSEQQTYRTATDGAASKPDSSATTPSHEAAAQWTRAQVVRDPWFYAILPGMTCQSLLYTGYMFHQIHLIESKGWALTLWASLYLLFSLTTLIMSFVIGAVVDRLGALRVIPFINLPMIIGLTVLASSNSSWAALVFMLCMGVSTAGQAACGAPFYSERYGNTHLASIKSLGSFYMVIMTAISPIVLGWLIDLGVSMNTLAIGGVAYALIVTSLATFGCRSARESRVPKLIR